MHQTQITFDDIPITILRKTVKHLNLRITREGQVVLTAPNKVPEQIIKHFIISKLNWIKNSRTRIKQQQIFQQPALQQDCKIRIFDKLLQVKENASQKNLIIELKDNRFILSAPHAMPEQTRLRLFQQWCKTQMESIVPELLDKWTGIVNTPYPEWKVRSMKSRWGSCNPSLQRISLNLYLIHYPLGCLEQVIVHELVHFFERHHNARFYALMDKHMPDWRLFKNMLDHKNDQEHGQPAAVLI